MSANIKFLSDFIFLNFQRTHDRIDIYRFPNRKWYFLRFQTIWFETLKKWNQTENRYLLTLFVLIWFTIQKRRGKIQTGENYVHQGLSKVFLFYTYSREFDVFLKMLVDIFLHYFNQPVHGLKLRDKFGLEKRPGVGLTGWNWMCGCTVVYCLYGIISMLGHLYLFHAWNNISIWKEHIIPDLTDLTWKRMKIIIS